VNCGLCGRALHGDAAAYLCPACTRATAERLERIPKLHTALAGWLAPAGRRPELGATPTAEPPLPVSETVLSLRGPGGIVGVLEDWRSTMQADRGWGEPAIAGDVAARVRRAARGLMMNLEWIASSWPAAGEFARELRELERSALSIIDPPERTIRLGHCTARVGDAPPCGAALHVPPDVAEVRCPRCRTEYPPDTWMALRAAQKTSDAA